MKYVISIHTYNTADFEETIFWLICVMSKAGVIKLHNSGYSSEHTTCVIVESEIDTPVKVLEAMSNHGWSAVNSFASDDELQVFVAEQKLSPIDFTEQFIRRKFRIERPKVRERLIAWCRQNAPESVKDTPDEDLWVYMHAAYEKSVQND